MLNNNFFYSQVVFGNIYICRKKKKNFSLESSSLESSSSEFFFIGFFSKISLSEFSSSELSLSELSLSESEEICISSIMYFFFKQHIYILLKTLEDNTFYLF